MGITIYLAKVMPHLASFTCPKRSVGNEWCWNTRGLSETEEGAQFKASVSSILTHETRLSADDSLFGLEGVLTQKQPENGLWKPVVYIY